MRETLHTTISELRSPAKSLRQTPRRFVAIRDEGRVVDGFWRVALRYGFIEAPDLSAALQDIKDLPEPIDSDRVVFFGTRDLVSPGKHSALSKWRLALFAFLYRNVARVSDRFDLPMDRTVEVARQV